MGSNTKVKRRYLGTKFSVFGMYFLYHTCSGQLSSK